MVTTPVGTHTFCFSKTPNIKAFGAAYFLNNEVLTINKKYWISGFCRSNDPTCQNSQCPDMRNSDIVVKFNNDHRNNKQ
jgi:hypothetical protein